MNRHITHNNALLLPIPQAVSQKAERKRLEKKKKDHEKQRKAAGLKQSREEAKKKRVAAKVAAKVAKDKDRGLKRAAADAKRRLRPPVTSQLSNRNIWTCCWV